MFNIQKYLRHAVLALGLAAGSLTAAASPILLPTYKISTTDADAANIGYVDVLFSAFPGATPVTASLTNFTGTPLDELDRTPGIGGVMGNYSIVNTGLDNDLFLGVNGAFAFDLNFSESFLSQISAENNNGFFSIVLYDLEGANIGDPFGALQFSLSDTAVNVRSTSSALSVAEVTAAAVPEPADWMLMLTGLVFVVCLTRKNGRTTARLTAA
jgi:hypothetical protein